MGWIFTFLCKQAKSEKSRLINIDRFMYDKIITMLISSREADTHEERQAAFLDLMLTDNFEYFQAEQLLTFARNAEL